ncbi:MAG: DUF4870 domain-containing protein [Anaerolineae bacterium]|nr:DUF4870 domain-containing protein [Anaerolineae bacterium]
MTELNEPIENNLPNESETPLDPTADALDDLQDTVETGAQSAAAAVDEGALVVVESVSQAGQDSTAGQAEEPPTIMDRLATDTEYDADATSDDRVMAALAYATQLILPFVVPIIILISETSKRRPFQRYHAIQSMAVAVVIYGLELALVVAASISLATIVLWLCLCFVIPAMIVLWLLPLYYAILAYNGKRFRIPGLTQFLHDQRWL